MLALGFTAHPKLFIAGGILTLLSVVWGLWSAPRINALIRGETLALERSRARTASLKSVMLKALSVLVSDLSLPMTETRVSVYRHTSSSFVLVSRLSEANSLRSKGRASYPEDQGVIGKAWDLGSAAVHSLPAERTVWNAYCETEWGVPRDVAAKLAMHSRSLIGKRIESPTDSSTSVGVIVIENLNARGVTSALLDRIETLDSWPLLVGILQEIVQCLDERDSLETELEGSPSHEMTVPRRAVERD